MKTGGEKTFGFATMIGFRDFQVAVSEADLWKVKASQKKSELLLYSQVAHPTTSAFLMKFEGYGGHFLVVEFSETGNAAYIFRMKAISRHRASRCARHGSS